MKKITVMMLSLLLLLGMSFNYTFAVDQDVTQEETVSESSTETVEEEKEETTTPQEEEEKSTEEAQKETNESNEIKESEEKTTSQSKTKKKAVLRAAAANREVDVEVTDFEIQNLNHETITRISNTSTFYLAMTWDASKYGSDLHAGDYFDVTLPDTMKFPASTTGSDFNITDENGNVIGTAHVTPGANDAGGTVRVTFTDAVENKYDVKGTMYLAAIFNQTTVNYNEDNKFSVTVGGNTTSTDIYVVGPTKMNDEVVNKWGQYMSSANANGQAGWYVRINGSKFNLTNLVVKDSLAGTGEVFLPEEFALSIVEYDDYGNITKVVQNLNVNDYITFNDDYTEFTLNLGNANGTSYRLTYKSTYTAGTRLTNNVSVTSDEKNTKYTYTYVATDSGGSGSGSLASKIKLTKVDAEDNSIVLANATFEVTRPNGTTFELTTGADGTVTSDKLTQGTYKVKEIKAPEGYELNDEEYELEVTATGGALKTITDNPIKTDITVKKVWDDSNNKDGVRPDSVTVKLLADGSETGDTAVLDASNNWSYTFNNLRQYKDGSEIKYTIEEETVSGYTSTSSVDGDTITLTNTHTPEKTSVSGKKTWDDNNNQDGIRPTSITVNLLANGEVVDSKTVTESDNWEYTFDNLDKNKDGNPITYTVSEESVDNYSTSIDGTNITNSYTPGKTSVPVQKVWDDNNNQDGIRPESVTVKLLADGEETGKTLTLDESNNFQGTFTDLDQKKNGNTIVYTVEEVSVDGYTTEITGDASGYTITNKHSSEETEVSGKKTWDDNDNQDGVRPGTITVHLLADGEVIDTKTVSESDNWEYTFSNLPKNKDGKEIEYTVSEEEVEGYTTEVSGYNITNTHSPEKTEVKGTKTWQDNDNQDGVRPDSITIHLLADGEEVDTKTVTESDNWEYTFDNLDVYKDGQKIVYTISEDPVKEYAVTYYDYDIHNIHSPGKINIPVTKIWNDKENQDGMRPESITVRLFADGVDTGKTLTLDASNDFKGTFEDLDERKNKGETIEYTVEEDSVDGYTTEIAGNKYGFIITNTHETEVTEVSGTKTWNDNNNQDGVRPDSITVKLLANGEVVDSKTVTEADNWAYTFDKLDKFKDGEEITYTVEEESVEGYETEISGYDITNTHTPELTSVSGTKTWDDNDNQDGIRPESITVKLLANGYEVDSKTVTEADNWSYTFDNLAKYSQGKEITYTIEEVSVEGYETHVNGYDMTNTHTPDKTTVSVTKVWDDENDKYGLRPQSITIKLLKNGTDTGETITLSQSNKWISSFDNIDKYENGKEITYTIEEVSVENYETSITGDASSGYTVTNTVVKPNIPERPNTPKKVNTSDSDSLINYLAIASIALLMIIILMKYKKLHN